MPKRAARTDANHAALIEFARSIGFTVHSTHAVGDDFPDAVVGIQGFTDVWEFKTEKGKLAPGQIAFLDTWQGATTVIRSQDDILARREMWVGIAARANKKVK